MKVEETTEMRFAGGSIVEARHVGRGHNVLGVRGVDPCPLRVLESWPVKVSGAVSITADEFSIVVSPETELWTKGQKAVMRADEIDVDMEIRVFDDIPHAVVVSSIERLDGGVKMMEFDLEGRASYVICNGFLVRA